jgi:hypothetical protein
MTRLRQGNTCAEPPPRLRRLALAVLIVVLPLASAAGERAGQQMTSPTDRDQEPLMLRIRAFASWQAASSRASRTFPRTPAPSSSARPSATERAHWVFKATALSFAAGTLR